MSVSSLSLRSLWGQRHVTYCHSLFESTTINRTSPQGSCTLVQFLSLQAPRTHTRTHTINHTRTTIHWTDMGRRYKCTISAELWLGRYTLGIMFPRRARGGPFFPSNTPKSPLFLLVLQGLQSDNWSCRILSLGDDRRGHLSNDKKKKLWGWRGVEAVSERAERREVPGAGESCRHTRWRLGESGPV